MNGQTLVTVHELSSESGIPPVRLYDLMRQGIIPAGVVVRLGRQVRVNVQKWREFVEAGGAALPGGWRRDASDRPERAISGE